MLTQKEQTEIADGVRRLISLEKRYDKLVERQAMSPKAAREACAKAWNKFMDMLKEVG